GFDLGFLFGLDPCLIRFLPAAFFAAKICGMGLGLPLADEKKMIVDAFRQHINTDGKIITSIFEVANQSALLSGEYEGYRVLFEDDL
ncbi:MAG: hypothetical protein IIT44_00540, partial [Erysipelotrichaceae bacterium]|nr:hypothetical protein [Erysipelotrichaceae bacterium]